MWVTFDQPEVQQNGHLQVSYAQDFSYSRDATVEPFLS
jgi:hypothetical protein